MRPIPFAHTKDVTNKRDRSSPDLKEKIMKTKQVLTAAHKLSKPYRVTDGKGFRLRDVDPGDTGDFKSEDKPRLKAALQTGVAALAELQGRVYAQDRWSVLLLIRRASTPHVAFLGRIPGARRYSVNSRRSSNEPTPGILAFRVEGVEDKVGRIDRFTTLADAIDAFQITEAPKR